MLVCGLCGSVLALSQVALQSALQEAELTARLLLLLLVAAAATFTAPGTHPGQAGECVLKGRAQLLPRVALAAPAVTAPQGALCLQLVGAHREAAAEDLRLERGGLQRAWLVRAPGHLWSGVWLFQTEHQGARGREGTCRARRKAVRSNQKGALQ